MTSNNNNNLLPVYAVVGTDKLKIKTVLERLDKRMNEFDNIDFNSDTFDGETANGAEIVQACLQIPFMSEKRYIVVKNASKIKNNDNETLLSYLNNPNDSTVLVLIYDKLAKSTRIYKACSKISSTSIIECQAPKKYKIAENLNSIARKHGGSIDFNAAKLLVDLIGEDTMHLDSEIQKLLISNNNKNITINQIKEEIQKSSEIKPWDFTGAFAARDIDTCLSMYAQMKENIEYVLLPQTRKIINELICVQDLGNHATQFSVANELGCQTWQVKNHIQWSKNFTKAELIGILEKALECEVKLKSTGEKNLAFEIFIIESLRRK